MAKHLPKVRVGIAGAVAASLALATAACGSGASGSGSDTAADKTITIGAVPGWTDQTGTAYLLANVLEANGYDVDIKKLSDNAPVYAGMAKGDIDIMGSSWLERTQAAYWKQYGKDLDDLGTFYEGAKLFFAVPTYSKITSMTELPDHADELGGKVYGIEPGAGLMKLSQDQAFPDYGLDKDYQLVSSSTSAMLTQLKKATDAKKDVVVTLWTPFWANQAFPVRPLDDPKGAFGAAEDLHTIANKEFAEAHPEVADMIAHFKLDDEQYGTLEDTIVNKFGDGQEAEAVAAWLKENPDYASTLASYLKK